MNLPARWSIVPLLFKPDAITGDAITVGGQLAADFAAYLGAAVDSLSLPDYVPFIGTSELGAQRARSHVLGEMCAIHWYRMPLHNVTGCQYRLKILQHNWAQIPNLAVVDVLQEACVALGFDIALMADRVLTNQDYMLFYGETNRPDMHEKMQRYMVGKHVRLILVCGEQENAALQIMKTYARAVMRYPTTKGGMENWIHVTNPDSSNYCDLLRMYAARSDELEPSVGPAGRAAAAINRP